MYKTNELYYIKIFKMICLASRYSWIRDDGSDIKLRMPPSQKHVCCFSQWNIDFLKLLEYCRRKVGNKLNRKTNAQTYKVYVNIPITTTDGKIVDIGSLCIEVLNDGHEDYQVLNRHRTSRTWKGEKETFRISSFFSFLVAWNARKTRHRNPDFIVEQV